VLNTADPRNIAFSFVAGGQWQDGVNFVVADSPGKCFSVTGAGSNVYVGGNKVRVPASFNPKTLLSCP
jgi:hypothetical protein